MINRREFLKNAYRIGGLAALYSLGAGAIEDAQGIGIFPVVNMGKEAPTYANWAEDSETTLDTTHIHCMMLENPVAGHETGTGLVTGVDLDWTMYNAVPGATGTPPSRQITEPDEGFTPTDTLLDVLTGSEFTILLKLENLANHHSTTEDYITYLRDSTDAFWRYDREADDTIDMLIAGTTHSLAAAPINSIVYFATWRGVGYNTRCGWTVAGSGANGQPTKYSDFDAANRADHGSAVSPTAGVWAFNNFFTSGTQTQGITAKAYHALLANISLIDNAA